MTRVYLGHDSNNIEIDWRVLWCFIDFAQDNNMAAVHHALFAYYDIFRIIYINKSSNLCSRTHSALIKTYGGYHADNMIICSELHFNLFQIP
jgi:hypothetical protein